MNDKKKTNKFEHATQCTSEPLEDDVLKPDQVENIGSPPIIMIQLTRPPTPYSAISN